MKNSFSQRALIIGILSVLMTIVLYTKCLVSKDDTSTYHFQNDSESLVLGKILADKYAVNSGNAGLGFFTFGEHENTPEKDLQSYTILLPYSFYFTDQGWTHGISRYWPGFYDINTPESRALYQKNRTVKLSDMDSRTIIETIEADSKYIHIHLSGDVIDPTTVGYPTDFDVYENGSMLQKYHFIPYPAQYGLQGRFFSFVYNHIGMHNIDTLNLICTAALAITLSLLCVLLACEYTTLLSVTFFLVFMTSRWIAAFSGNLYWVPFTWFLPAVFSLLLFRNKKRCYLYLPLIYLSVLIKSLCGYEYLSTILIFSVFFWIVEFVVNDKGQRKNNFILLTTIGIVCILAFISALLIHASMRGETIIDGLSQTWQRDVLRRTYSTDPGQFDPMFTESLLATPLQTIARYIPWRTQIIFGVSGKLFSTIVLGAFCILAYEAIRCQKNAKKDWALFFVTLTCPLSWFVLAKAHSYIHVDVNAVLWYFGFIQILFYIIIKFVLEESSRLICRFRSH